MPLKRMDNVGVAVDDLAAAIAFDVTAWLAFTGPIQFADPTRRAAGLSRLSRASVRFPCITQSDHVLFDGTLIVDRIPYGIGYSAAAENCR